MYIYHCFYNDKKFSFCETKIYIGNDDFNSKNKPNQKID
jgi:hypothetical protein